MQPWREKISTVQALGAARWDGFVSTARERLPVLTGALDLARETDLVDRAAALALFCMLTLVPAMFGIFSALGFVFDRIDTVAHFAGFDAKSAAAIVARATQVIQTALPGVTWDPSTLASTLVRDRAANGAFSSVTALALGLTLFSRIDNNVRVIFGRRRRSAFRAAGIFGLFFLVGSLLALILSVAAPLTSWGLHLAAKGMSTLSFGWVDGFTMVVAITQTLPIAIGFYVLVRWSAGRRRVSRRRLAAISLWFGALWFLGQRAFSLYVGQIIRMDAIYGALTGVVALMLWLYYASLAFLIGVTLLASWERYLQAQSEGGAALTDEQSDVPLS
ncbi:MAG: YihY/virulence factor BrkB family protein [Myxococcales bacterium]|nr:YihY/virulence factor BrkB family protein [Myxococcales bacterium]